MLERKKFGPLGYNMSGSQEAVVMQKTANVLEAASDKWLP
jgi:hypothetical protein